MLTLDFTSYKQAPRPRHTPSPSFLNAPNNQPFQTHKTQKAPNDTNSNPDHDSSEPLRSKGINAIEHTPKWRLGIVLKA